MIGPRDWYVAFYDTPGPRRRLWGVFTWHRPGFGHCSAFGYCPEADVWIFADWTAEGLAIFALDDERVDAMLLGLADIAVILETKTAGERPFPLGWPLFCVSMTKHLIGLKSWAWTPWQLYRALLRRGARRRFQELTATIREHEHDPRKIET
jgi:hypothetical protein